MSESAAASVRPQERAVLFTDVVDSTRVHEAAGDETARRVWNEHDAGARAALRRWRGQEVGRTDGFLVVFAEADDAMGFANDYHRLLAALEPPLSARVGVDWGPVVLQPNASDDVAAGATAFELHGLTVPAAARVMSTALAGQTLLTRELAARLGDASALHSHGFWRMKGLDDPLELLEASCDGRPVRAPADAAKAHRVVQKDGVWLPVRELPNNLGPERDAFVRRDPATRDIAQAFDDGARLVTVLGTGGVGKTRLAQHYARSWIGAYPGGAWFCDLSAARTLDGIAFAISQATGLALGSGDPVQQLARGWAARGETLVILDNFEQIARLAPATLGVWQRDAPEVRFLVTSREALNIAGERILVLSPMSNDEAQRLFRARVEADAGVTLEPADDAALPTLVDLLDRLPLAIELAAARARVVPPADQHKRIGERFKLLASRGTRHDRQATLRATLDWSWDLLTPAEQSALAQLSVFEGGFTLQAVEAVLDVSAFDEVPWPADLVQALVEKSLVRRIGPRRFDLLVSIQDYAAERRSAMGADLAFERHWQYFAGLSEAQCCADRGVDLDNLAAACRRGTAAINDGRSSEASRHAVRALINAWNVLRLTGPFRAAIGLAEPLAERDDFSGEDTALVHRVLGGATALMGRRSEALDHYRRALACVGEDAPSPLATQLLILVAGVHIGQRRLTEAASFLTQAESRAKAGSLEALLCEKALGQLAENESDPDRAHRHFSNALGMAQSLGEERQRGGIHGSLGTVEVKRGSPRMAKQHYLVAVQVAEGLGDRQWAAIARCNLGRLFNELGDTASARESLDLAIESARETGHRVLEAEALWNLGLVEAVTGHSQLAIGCFKASVDLAVALDFAPMEAHFRGYLADAMAMEGQEHEALACIDRASRLLAAEGASTLTVTHHCQRSTVESRLGRLEAASDSLKLAEGLAAQLPPGALEKEAIDALDRARRRMGPE